MKKNVCEITFNRENGKQTLHIQMAEPLEALFKSDETETSKVYKNARGNGLEYYKLEESLTKYQNQYSRTNNYNRVTLEHFGTQLYDDNGYTNLSVLRTVGISDGIDVVVDELIVDTEVQKWIQELARFVKFMYSNYIEKTQVTATINLEL